MFLLLVLLVMGAGVLWLARPRFGRGPLFPMASNEIGAIAILRTTADSQEWFRSQTLVDVDGDGEGEFGSLAELTGADGPRTNTDGTKRGAIPAVLPLSPSLRPMSDQGLTFKAGYTYRVFLPGESGKAVHEHARDAGTAKGVAFTGAVDTDAAESTWWAYSWPVGYGNSGRRAFFIHHDGVVFETDNQRRQYSGEVRMPDALAAFTALEGGVLSLAVADGTVGRDGQVWKRVK